MDRRRACWAGVFLSAVTVLALGSEIVSAHTVSTSRFDAPLPLSLLFVGAGGTVALTALWLAVTGRSKTTAEPRHVVTISAPRARWLKAGVGAVFFCGVVAAIGAGFVGRQVAAENFATVFVWPVWFRGLALLALLVGSPWTTLSPWLAIYRGLCRLEGDQLALLGDYPDRLGSWPAVIGFLVLIGVIENLTVLPRSPTLTAVVVAVYALVMLVGGVLFGPVWFDRADPLGVLYRLFGRVSGLHATRSTDGGLVVSARSPWRGCLSPVSESPIAVFVIAAVYTVSFDGFTNTRHYQQLLFDTREALGTGPPTSVLLYLVGLVAFIGVFVVIIGFVDSLGTSSTQREGAVADGGHQSWRGAVCAFAPTVLPIAAAYDVAHNYPYVVQSTARLIEIIVPRDGVGVADPLGWLSLPGFWGSQVLLIVVGHIIAAVAAHHVAVDRFRTPSAARRGHLPLVVLMIGYTVVSLWIISQPVVA
jgi:hypothetical protein